jgi:hypothetical protein
MEFNLEKEIKCVCGVILEDNDFSIHIKKCELFRETFSDFDNQISKLIKSYSKPREQLAIIKFILQKYVNILDKKIRGNFVEITKAFKESFIKSLEENKKDNENNFLDKDKNNNNNIFEKMFSFDNK